MYNNKGDSPMKKSYKNKHGLSKKETLIYGIANGGQVFGYSLVTSYLMYFYSECFSSKCKNNIRCIFNRRNMGYYKQSAYRNDDRP